MTYSKSVVMFGSKRRKQKKLLKPRMNKKNKKYKYSQVILLNGSDLYHGQLYKKQHQ